MKVLAFLISLFMMLTGLIIIAALIAVAYYLNPILAIICFFITNSSMKDVGGWFFAWKKSTRQAFAKNLEEIYKQS